MPKGSMRKRVCGVCGRPVSRSGRAWVSHMRAHEREGLVRERPGSGRLRFDLTKRGLEFKRLREKARGRA